MFFYLGEDPKQSQREAHNPRKAEEQRLVTVRMHRKPFRARLLRQLFNTILSAQR